MCPCVWFRRAFRGLRSFPVARALLFATQARTSQGAQVAWEMCLLPVFLLTATVALA